MLFEARLRAKLLGKESQRPGGGGLAPGRWAVGDVASSFRIFLSLQQALRHPAFVLLQLTWSFKLQG